MAFISAEFGTLQVHLDLRGSERSRELHTFCVNCVLGKELIWSTQYIIHTTGVLTAIFALHVLPASPGSKRFVCTAEAVCA